MNIGTRIKCLLEEENMTQKELADILHISASTLNGYIKKGKEPDYAILIRLANYFNTTTDYLLGRSNMRTASDQPLSLLEGELIGIYRRLPDEQQQIVRESVMIHYRHSCNSSGLPPKSTQSQDL
ncbi:MAG: helix-turn-helix domain-containing protein [Roseburia sp.]